MREEAAASAKALRSMCAQAVLWNQEEASVPAAERVSEGMGVVKVMQGLAATWKALPCALKGTEQWRVFAWSGRDTV